MSNTITLTFFLTIMTLSTQGQIRSILNNADEIEIRMGPSIVSLYNKNITNDIRLPKMGYTAKIGLMYYLSENLSLTTNLLYERGGLKTESNVWYYDPTIDSTNCKCTTSLGLIKSNSNLDYLTIEVLTRFHKKKSGFYMDAGLFLGHLLKAQGRLERAWDNSIEYSNLIDYYKKMNFGISVSIGYKIKINSDRTYFVIQLTDNLGVLSISNSTTRTTTNSLLFSLGLNHKIN